MASTRSPAHHVRAVRQGEGPLEHAAVHEHPQQLVLLGRAHHLAELRHVPERLGEGGLEVLEVERLDEEVEGPAVHRHADVAHVAVGGDHDDLDERIDLAHPRQEGEPVHPRHVDVGEHDIGVRVLAQLLQGVLAVGGEDELVDGLADVLAEALLHQQRHVRLVIDDEDLRGARGAAGLHQRGEGRGQLPRGLEAARGVRVQGAREEGIQPLAQLGHQGGRRLGEHDGAAAQLAERVRGEGEAAGEGR